MKRNIYFDSASTTYVGPESLEEMMSVFDSSYGNANSLHAFGRHANSLADKARDRIAKAINAKSNEIYFTSGGTESNNWAIKGLAYANRKNGNHIITSQIEHPSVLESFKELEKEGFKVTYLPVDSKGFVNLAKLLHHLDNETILVSVMMANNEVGTIQHINAIAKTVKESGAIFHTDAVQAMGSIPIDVKNLSIDAMTISSHKLYGPKGAGALYVKKGVRIKPLIVGGSQEYSKRAGTVNTPAIVGFGKAVEVAVRDMKVNTAKLKKLRDYFVKEVQAKIEGVHLNGHNIQRLSHVTSLSFDFIEGESILLMLDLEGVAVSTGSACSAGDLTQSHVLTAMGLEPALANGTVRFSMTRSATKEDVDYVVEKLIPIVEKLRAISPLTKKRKNKRK